MRVPVTRLLVPLRLSQSRRFFSQSCPTPSCARRLLIGDPFCRSDISRDFSRSRFLTSVIPVYNQSIFEAHARSLIVVQRISRCVIRQFRSSAQALINFNSAVRPALCELRASYLKVSLSETASSFSRSVSRGRLCGLQLTTRKMHAAAGEAQNAPSRRTSWCSCAGGRDKDVDDKDDAETVEKRSPPLAREAAQEVKIGFVDGEDRGPNPMRPPRTKEDSFYWLRDDSRASPEVLQHLKDENAYTRYTTTKGALKECAGLEEELYKEHLSHLKETDARPPYAYGEHWEYYTRTVEGRSYKIHCRRPQRRSLAKAEDAAAATPSGGETIVLDENVVSGGQAQCDIACVAVSPCHDYLAYCVDFSGDEVYDLRIVKPGSTETLDEVKTVEDEHMLSGNVAWSADYSGIFYVTQDPTTHRPNKLWFHEIAWPGKNKKDDVFLFEETDALFVLDIGKTKDGRYLCRNSCSSETTEVTLLNLETLGQNKTGEPVFTQIAVHPRTFGLRYEVEHYGNNRFVALTNWDKAQNMRCLVFEGTTGDEDQKVLSFPETFGGWKELFPYEESREIAGIEVFRDFLVFEGRELGLTQIWWLDMTAPASSKHELRLIEWPEPLYEANVSINKNYTADYLRVHYSSLTTPSTWYEFYPSLIAEASGATQKPFLKKVHEEPVPNFDGGKYTCARTHALAEDGTKIPISLVWNKDQVGVASAEELLRRRAASPLLLYGYGAYGCCCEPGFDRDVIPYLDRGIIYAIAHVRGGGEMGRKLWYEDGGKYLNKRNTFTDFIACAKHLVRKGATAPEKMALEGRSAGGLLVGAVLNMQRERRDGDTIPKEKNLFRVAVAGVPFVDVLTTMSDSSIPLTVGEWEEWGNPNEEKFYEYMKSYSPVDNVLGALGDEKGQKVVGDAEKDKENKTTVIILAGLHDPRVAYWEPAKWAQLLRKRADAYDKILLKVDLDVGHFSASDRYRHLRETSFAQAIVIRELLGP
ncbi:unnamed protein product [Amoebophrya sp. A25]|nr:unnamed protein product [Amoebophrya sp. A25]|eukprot:GSA25T00023667001.1